MTLREYISFWQETYDRHQSRPTTYAAHNYVFKNHIIPGLGATQLSELTSEMVGEFLEERKRFGNHRPGSSGLGEETMRHIHRLLQQCLDKAIRDGLITENPAKAFRYRKSATVKANIMTPLEMEDYLDAAERLGYLPMFMLALTTGIRQGELIAMKWSDLDIENRTLTIAENRSVVRRELVEYGRQTRLIRLTPEVVDLLIMEHSKHPSSPLMFMHPATLKPYSPQMVRRMHNEIIKEAGIDHIRYVDLRHTCAILALKNGMDTNAIDFEGYNPKKVILEQLRAKPEIDYEKCSKLLFKLITQVCDHYETRYGTNGMQNIIMMYKRDIGNKIYKQMLQHFYCENGFLQEEVVGTRKYNLQQSYRYSERANLFSDEYTENIQSVLFEGIKRGVFSTAKFDSRPELLLARILETESADVQNWLRPAPQEFNITYNHGHNYEPDFVVETEDTIYLVEVKGEDKLNDPDVIAKKKRGIQYCEVASRWGKANGYKQWRYLFIPSKQVMPNSSFMQLAKRFGEY